MQPVQRDGLEYEFDIVGDIDQTHTLTISKTRYSGIADRVIAMPGEPLGVEIQEWLQGVEAPAPEEDEEPSALKSGPDFVESLTKAVQQAAEPQLAAVQEQAHARVKTLERKSNASRGTGTSPTSDPSRRRRSASESSNTTGSLPHQEQRVSRPRPTRSKGSQRYATKSSQNSDPAPLSTLLKDWQTMLRSPANGSPEKEPQRATPRRPYRR